MNPEKFTTKAQNAIEKAFQLAASDQQIADTPHLFLSLVQEVGGTTTTILNHLKQSSEALISATELMRQKSAVSPTSSGAIGQVMISSQLGAVFGQAKKESDTLTDEYISTEHLLLALSVVKSPIQIMLEKNGITREEILKALAVIRGGERVTDPHPEDKYQALEKYGRNLTDAAKNHKLDPVIGRDEEIRRLMQVLSRRTKNNPVLIGEAGVGKTAIVEGLAQRIISG